MEKKRLTGATIFGILMILHEPLREFFAMTAVAMLNKSTIAHFPNLLWLRIVEEPYIGGVIVKILAYTISFAIGLGIIAQWRQARIVLLCWISLFTLNFTGLLFWILISQDLHNFGSAARAIQSVFALVFYIAMFYYFTRPKVKEQFK